jgi:hypothetical protein
MTKNILRFKSTLLAAVLPSLFLAFASQAHAIQIVFHVKNVDFGPSSPKFVEAQRKNFDLLATFEPSSFKSVNQHLFFIRPQDLKKYEEYLYYRFDRINLLGIIQMKDGSTLGKMVDFDARKIWMGHYQEVTVNLPGSYREEDIQGLNMQVVGQEHLNPELYTSNFTHVLGTQWIGYQEEPSTIYAAKYKGEENTDARHVIVRLNFGAYNSKHSGERNMFNLGFVLGFEQEPDEFKELKSGGKLK